MTLEHFLSAILPEFDKYPLLRDSFSYSFASDKEYHNLFKGDICLVFKVDKLFDINIAIQEIKAIMYKYDTQVILSIQPENIFYYVSRQRMAAMFRSAGTDLQHMMSKLVAGEKKLEKTKVMIIHIIICSHILKYIKLPDEDLDILFKVLEYNWLTILKSKSDDISRDELEKLRNLRREKLREYFSKESDIVCAAIKKGQSYDTCDSHKIYGSVLAQLDALFGCCH